MSELREVAIKLFGRTIQLLPHQEEGLACKAATLAKASSSSEEDQNPSEYDYTEAKREDVSLQPYEEDLRDPSTSSGMDYDPKSPNTYKETSSANTNKIEDLRETSNFEEKTLKKPDKIVPCPRCESMDTKFCYYNNYNVNQPRHFCKNCQRYWTAGGTMRNLPVGSGRRKSKSASASWYRHIVVSEALRAAGAKATSGIHHPSVLAFRSDAPLCESMTSALNLKDKAQNSLRNEFQQQKQKKVDDHPTVSSTAALSLTDMVKNGQSKNIQCNPRQVSIFPDPPWPYQWNSAQFRSPMAPISPTNFDPSSFPASVYPTPQYWGYTLPGPWSLPWLSQHSISPNHQNAFPSGPSSPLGKHSRDGSMLKASSNSGKVKEVLIPKTLIINDSNEPAKGLIWSALGIQNEGDNSVAGASLFNAFQTKDDQQNYVAENSMPLHANPAALSRSLNFHESS